MTQEDYNRLKMTWAVQNGGMSPDPVLTTTDYVYNLFNINDQIQKVLSYHSQSGDTINLGWAEKGQAFHVRFAKEDGSEGPITYEEPIAFAVVRGKFVKYQPGREGINLGWTETPIFEWSFVGGPAGEPVKVGTIVALYNAVEKDCLFYEERTNGVNLKWVRDKGEFEGWVKFKHAIGTVAHAYNQAKSYF
jgi:hypothetical protein